MIEFIASNKKITQDKVESVVRGKGCIFNVTSLFNDEVPLFDLLMITVKEKINGINISGSDKTPFSEYNNTKGKIHIDVQ